MPHFKELAASGFVPFGGIAETDDYSCRTTKSRTSQVLPTCRALLTTMGFRFGFTNHLSSFAEANLIMILVLLIGMKQRVVFVNYIIKQPAILG
jgi:hypothetical protein